MSTTKKEALEAIEGLPEQVEMDDIIARLYQLSRIRRGLGRPSTGRVTGVAERPDRDRRALLLQFLQEEAWPLIPEGEVGRRLSRDEEDQLLGYGPEGV